MVIIALMVGAVMTTAGPRRDVDFWWHVLLGRALLADRTNPQAGDWTTLSGRQDWQSGQPWSEAGMAVLEQLAPETCYVWLRAITLGLALIALSWATGVWTQSPPGITTSVLPRWPAWVAFLAGVWTVTGFTQERPQQVSYLLYPLAGALIAAVLDPTGFAGHNRLGCATVAGVVTMLWVQSHQGWLLVLGVLGLATILSLRPGRQSATALLLLGVVSVAAGTNPWGLAAPHAAQQLAAASAALVEWQPTALFSIPGAGTIALIVGFTAVWVRGPRRLPEILVVLLLLVTAATAARGIAPAMLLAAPILARHSGPPRAPRTPVLAMCAAVTAGAVVWAANTQSAAPSSTSPDPQETVARLAAGAVCRSPETAVVIATAYNDSGAALFGGRRSPCASGHQVKVAIDGRADRYGAHLIQRWLAVEYAHGDWLTTWRQATPNLAILRRDSPLVAPLTALGWRVVDDTAVEFVVMAPDTS